LPWFKGWLVFMGVLAQCQVTSGLNFLQQSDSSV